MVEGLVMVGSQDGSIRVWSGAEAVGKLSGHTENVCALSMDERRGLLLSASWDKTGRVWSLGGECLAVLEGHQAALWDIVAVPGASSDPRLPDLLTASADRTIIHWKSGRRHKEFVGMPKGGF